MHIYKMFLDENGNELAISKRENEILVTIKESGETNYHHVNFTFYHHVNLTLEDARELIHELDHIIESYKSNKTLY